ncbi:hypothetical protein D9X91_05155 [Falsibacillus albus]|uniref:Uncharacterized protein n=1 Tax=Falsibacillus albus TaxID=2478915 RepID=A0A3L7K4B3_9BACI|nr:hypothetical protein D9X91_05155 [Falsibacillus albus]
MFQSFALNLFLYFPEDKREYIPAAITMAVFTVFAIITFRIIIYISKREERKTKDLEDHYNPANGQEPTKHS